jgi:sugar-phosphatase
MNDKLITLINDADAVIFDMDGLLVDSEPYWKIAEKQVFGQYGLKLTDDLLRQVMGFRLNEVVKYWYNYQPWPDADFEHTEKEILAVMENLLSKHAIALPGVYELIEYIAKTGEPMAVASSSAMRLIEVVVEKLNIKQAFKILHSAEFEPYGKPHPGIFITTAQKLGVAPERCLVFEDSINGVIAAKAARMKCVAVPETATQQDPRFVIADLKITSLDD